MTRTQFDGEVTSVGMGFQDSRYRVHLMVRITDGLKSSIGRSVHVGMPVNEAERLIDRLTYYVAKAKSEEAARGTEHRVRHFVEGEPRG